MTLDGPGSGGDRDDAYGCTAFIENITSTRMLKWFTDSERIRLAITHSLSLSPCLRILFVSSARLKYTARVIELICGIIFRIATEIMRKKKPTDESG